MAKDNAIQLSPQETRQPKDARVAEDEIEAGSDDERAANNLNVGLRSGNKQIPKEVPTKGLRSRLTRYLGFGGASSSQNIDPEADADSGKEGQVVADAKEDLELNFDKSVENGNRIVVKVSQAAEEEGAEMTPTTSQNPTTRKRKSHQAREAQSERLNGGEDVEESPRKRGKTSKRPEQKPRTSIKRTSAVGTQHQTRAQARAASREPATKSISRPSGTPRANKPEEVAEPSKRGRGRPRGSRKRATPKVSKDVPRRSGEQSVDIYSVLPNLSGDDEEDVDTVERASGIPDGSDDQEEESAKTITSLIPPELLENMLETAQQVGHSRRSEEFEEIICFKAPSSQFGKRLHGRIKKLTEAYQALKVLKADGYNNATEDDQNKSVDSIESILEESQRIVKEGLADKARGSTSTVEERTDMEEKMLKDIYFILVPKLVEALKTGVELYKDEEISETKVLPQVIYLFDLLRELGEGALRLSKATKPQPSSRNPYRFSSPTASLMQIVRSVIKTLQTELWAKEREKKNAAWNNGAAERERKRAAQEQREEEMRQRKIIEISKRQREALNEKLKGRYGRYLQDALEEPEAKNARLRAATFDDSIERVSVFRGHNTQKDSGPRALSRKEKKLFTRIMRYDQTPEQKAGRYEKAAEVLGLSMDDIFAHAKDLQATCDAEHEKGNYNEPGDEWTYDIWVGQP